MKHDLTMIQDPGATDRRNTETGDGVVTNERRDRSLDHRLFVLYKDILS